MSGPSRVASVDELDRPRRYSRCSTLLDLFNMLVTYLSRGVAHFKGDRLSVHVHDDVVRVNGRGDVFSRVTIGRVGHDKRSLPHGAVADEHALDFIG